jgi:hypothetical protein
MTTQTITGTSTAAAALMLAGTQAPTTTPIFRGFGSKPTGSKGSSRNPPSGPPGGGGLPGPFGPPGGGTPHGGLGPARAGGGGGAKLGGNLLRFAERCPTWTMVMWMQPLMTQLLSSDTRYSNTRSPL